jgi:hypothetical protein
MSEQQVVSAYESVTSEEFAKILKQEWIKRTGNTEEASFNQLCEFSKSLLADITRLEGGRK